MNIAQITKDYEDYKKGLEQDLHKLDDVKQNWSEELIFYKNETLKMPDKLQEESGQSVEEWEKGFEELYKSAMFPYTCVLPLLTIISHFVTKTSTPFSTEGVNMPKNPSVRDVYRVLSKIPENTALFFLDSIGIGFMIDAFRDGEDGFASAFVSLENKTKIMDELVIIAKAIELGSFAECVSEINDMNTLEAVKFYMQEFKNSVRSHSDFEYLNSVFDADLDHFIQMDNNTSSIIVDDAGVTDLFKKLLIKYIQLSPDFDSYTQACADKILNNPDYLDITNELLEECKTEITKESEETKNREAQCVADEKPGKRGNGKVKKPFPLAFPNHIGITEKEAQLKFLDKLYNTLIENKFVSKDTRLDVFQYLLGGGNKPNDYKGERIIWNNDLPHVQIFYLCYYGITIPKTSSYDWEPLKKIFAIEGKTDISSNAKKNVENQRYSEYFTTFKDYITIAKPI